MITNTSRTAGPTLAPGPEHLISCLRKRDGNHTLNEDKSTLRPTIFLKKAKIIKRRSISIPTVDPEVIVGVKRKSTYKLTFALYKDRKNLK